MKTLKLIFFVSFTSFVIMQACKEDIHTPVNQGGEVPAPIMNPIMESLPGASKISYEVLNDANLLYVKATYEPQKGITREVKASYYTNNLIVDGFGDTLVHQVKLYTVGRNNKESEPVIVAVKPQSPPIYGIFASIAENVKETFGGIKFNVKNPSEAKVRIYVSTTDSLGEWGVAETIYTSSVIGNFSVRGYDSIARPFRIYVKDRWDNSSDTFEGTFHPWFEEKLDKTKFRQVNLPTDQNTPNASGRGMEKIWDESYGNDDFVTTVGYGIPQWFTFDLGVNARLSRIIVYNRSAGANFIYNAGAVKEWEIFGSINPNPDGSFDSSWSPLRDNPCVSFKPSGLPLGEYNSDDIQRQINGEEFEFDANTLPVRYLRWRTNAVWGGASIGHINLVEINVFGSVIKD